jgi:hypothetical protein
VLDVFWTAEVEPFPKFHAQLDAAGPEMFTGWPTQACAGRLKAAEGGNGTLTLIVFTEVQPVDEVIVSVTACKPGLNVTGGGV